MLISGIIKYCLMNKMNILIIGDGFIGASLFKFYKSLNLPVTNTNKQQLDVANCESIGNFLKNTNYTHIIYCAGVKDLKLCEANTNIAYEINSNAVEKISKYITKEKFVYISTDYVFDGQKGNYSEEDNPNPLTTYGKSKLLGEQYTCKYFKDYVVVRTSGVYGIDCKWVQWLLNTKEEVVCYVDVYNSPTYVNNLARMILNVFHIDFVGTINLAGSSCVNRFELYNGISEYNKLFLNLTKGYCNNTFPNNISLNVDLYKKLTNDIPLTLEQGFKDLFNEN